MKPSQFNLIRRMWIRATRYRYREKIARKNRTKELKLIHKQEKNAQRVWRKEQRKLCTQMYPVPKVIHTSRFYRNITIAIFFGWFILWLCVISIPTRPSDSFLDSLFLLIGWGIFLLYPMIRYIVQKRDETAKRDTTVCPLCGSTMENGYNFCTSCGFSLIPHQPQNVPQKEKRCPSCGVIVDKNYNFCTECGYSFLQQPKVTKLSAEERKKLREKYKMQREIDQHWKFRQKRIEDDMLRNIKSQNYKLKREDDKENRDQCEELTK